ncbi:hypothetical protein [Streptomyces sp. NPDC048385]|uniref:hypothetical protein n=1 Tax=unclassified Streptomyces TaxID=2593676 RepID=UPI0034312F6E
MDIDLNDLLNVATTLGAVALGAWLTALTSSRAATRADVKAEHDALGGQFDAMLIAVAGLRAAVEADHTLWSNWKEQLRTVALSAVTGLAPGAFVKGSDRRQIAAVVGGAGWFLALERHQSRTASAGLMPKLTAVAAAAAPLLRHSNREVREATERLMNAVFGYHESRKPQELEAAMADFGTAVRAVLNPAAPARRRLPWRRSSR